MAQPTYFPTGIDEWDLEIMRQMDDVTLARWCRVNADLRNLCDDEPFWKKRSQLHRRQLLQFVDRYSSWREFYKNILHDMVYLLYTPYNNYRAFNDPTAAYDQFAYDLTNLLLTMEEITTGVRPDNFWYDGIYEILLVFRNDKIAFKDRRKYTLFSLGREREEEVTTADINNYPVLLSNKPLLVLEVFGGIIEIRDLTSIELDKVHRRILRERYRSVNNIADVLLAKPRHQSIYLDLTSYGFGFDVYNANGNTTRYELVDLAKLSSSVGFVIYEVTGKDFTNMYGGDPTDYEFYQSLIQQQSPRLLRDIFSL